jgi:hypothetical protein
MDDIGTELGEEDMEEEETELEVERVLCEVTGEVSRDLVGLSAGIGGSPAKTAVAAAEDDDDGLVDRLRAVRSSR